MMNIRIIKEEDLETLADIYVQAYRLLHPVEKWTTESAYKLLSYQRSLHPDLAFLAEEDSTIHGAIFSAIKPWWDGNRLIDGEFFIHPECQHEGIGSMLLEHLMNAAKEKYDATYWDL